MVAVPPAARGGVPRLPRLDRRDSGERPAKAGHFVRFPWLSTAMGDFHHGLLGVLAAILPAVGAEGGHDIVQYLRVR